MLTFSEPSLPALPPSRPRNGLHKIYYASGSLRAGMTYRDGKLDGWFRSFFPNGQPYLAATYRHGRRQGIWRLYSETGALLGERHYHDDLLLDSAEEPCTGVQLITYPDQQPRLLEHYCEGRLHGEARAYFADGKIRYRKHYRQGRLEGTVQIYYPNGHLRFRARFRAGKMEGEFKSFLANGRLKACVQVGAPQDAGLNN